MKRMLGDQFSDWEQLENMYPDEVEAIEDGEDEPG